MTTPQRRPRRPRAESGEEVLHHLLDVAPAGLSRAELLQRLGPTYSPSQAASGIAWVKQVGASREGRPYAWSRKNGAGFPEEVQEWINHEISQGRRAYTTLDNVLKSTVDPHLQRLPQDPTVRRLHERLSNAARELGIALEELKHPPGGGTPVSV